MKRPILNISWQHRIAVATVVTLAAAALTADALTLTGVVSRKTHPGGGAHDVVIDTRQTMAGTATIEPRSIGAGHSIVFKFDGPVTSPGTLSIVDGTLQAVNGGTAFAAGNEVTVSLPGLADRKRATVALANVNNAGVDVAATVGFLAGDVNATGTVNNADVIALKTRAGQRVGAGNYAFDVNSSGVITAADIVAAKARAGAAVEPPPAPDATTVGPTGGVVTGPDGVQVVIPGNAVTAPVTFRVARDSTGAPELAGINAVSPVYAVMPHGQAFETAALLSIPLSAAQIPPGATPVMLKAELGGNWQVVPNVSADPLKMAADISGLSFFVIGTCSSVPTDAWTIGGIDCPANHELRLTMLDNETPVSVIRGPNGVQLPLWYVTDTPQTRDFVVDWTRPNSARVDDVSVVGSRGGFNPQTRSVTGGNFSQRFTVSIDPAQVAGANGPNGRLLRVVATAQYSTTATRVGVGSVPVGFAFETDIPILVRYNGILPVISQHPANTGVVAGQAASFTVVASGASLSYQWSRRPDANAAFADIVGATAATLSLPTTTVLDNTAQFRVRVCSGGSNCVDSNAAVLLVAAVGLPPTFSLVPGDLSVAFGQTASFSVVAGGTPLPQIRWQVAPAGSTTFTDLVGSPTCAVASPIAGSGNVAATCTVGPVSLGSSGLRYRAVATNAITPGGVTSSFGTLTVTAAPQAPVITQHPAPQSTNVGGSATFSVTATGTSTITYVWRLGGDFLPAGNGGFAFGACSGSITHSNGNQSITLSNLSAGCGGLSVAATASNSVSPSATSNGALLSVNQASGTTAGLCFAGTSGWCYAKPLPQAGGLTGLVYRSGEFTAVGSAGITLRTPDNGTNWQAAFDALRGNWSDVASPSPGLLVAAGSFRDFASQNSGVFTSGDNGATWTRRLDAGLPGAVAVSRLAFANNLLGVAVGYGGIWRTEDGGLTWAAVAGVPSLAGVVSPSGGGAVWADATTVLIYGLGGTILRSADAGLTWIDVSLGSITADYTDMAFNSAGVGIAVGPAREIARSSDYGATWVSVATSMDDSGSAIAFIDDDTVAALGTTSQSMRSADGGLTWTVGYVFAGFNVYRMRFADASTGLAVGAIGGRVLRTQDGGVSWSVIGGGSMDDNIEGLAASPSGSVVLAGALNGRMLRSITAGATWDDAGVNFRAPSFGSEQVAIAVSAGQIARSADAGQTWAVVHNQPGAGFTNSTMASAGVGLAVGNAGLILRSTNGGLTFAPVSSGTIAELKSVRCLTATLCLAGGYPGNTVLRSTDAGATWSQVTMQLLSGSAFIRSFARIDDTTVVVATDSELQRSTDGGQTWSRVYTSVLGSQLAVAFNASGIGIAAGYEGVLRSTDHGLTWVRQGLPVGYVLSATTWVDGNTVLVAGDGGAILRNLQSGAP